MLPDKKIATRHCRWYPESAKKIAIRSNAEATMNIGPELVTDTVKIQTRY